MTQNNDKYEEFKVSSDNLVSKVKELIRSGNIRRIYIKNDSGKTLLTIPLSAGAAVTAVAIVFAPTLAAVAAIAALFTSVTVGIERRDDPKDNTPTEDSEPVDPDIINPT